MLKIKVPIIRIVFSALFGELSIISLFLPLSSISILLVKLFISIFMIVIAFSYKNHKYFRKAFSYFYLLSIILGGVLYLFKEMLKIENNDLFANILILIIFGPYYMYHYLKENRNYKNNIDLYHNIDIYLDNKKYSYKAYIDTGNTLKDPYKKRSIILISEKELVFNYEKSILVPYTTVSEEGLIKCQKPDKVVLDNEIIINNMLIGTTNKDFNKELFDCILPNDISNYF